MVLVDSEAAAQARAALRDRGSHDPGGERRRCARRRGDRRRGAHRDGGDRRGRRTAADARGGARRQARAARQQGGAGDGRTAAHGGSAPGANRTDPDRQRAQRDLSMHAGRLPSRRGGARRDARDPDRLGRSVSLHRARAARARDARAGLRSSEVENGAQDLRRLRDAHEQGARGDRGDAAVRPARVAGRAWWCIRRAWCIRWSNTPTARCSPSSARPTCARRSPRRSRGRSGWFPVYNRSTSVRSGGWISSRRITCAFPSLELARAAARAGGTAPAVLNAANEVAVQAFLDRRLNFTGIAAVIDKVLQRLDARPVEGAGRCIGRRRRGATPGDRADRARAWSPCMKMLIFVAAFLVAIGILVAVHEFGHYWVAKKLGFKVLRFSIGFGKPLAHARRSRRRPHRVLPGRHSAGRLREAAR